MLSSSGSGMAFIISSLTAWNLRRNTGISDKIIGGTNEPVAGGLFEPDFVQRLLDEGLGGRDLRRRLSITQIETVYTYHERWLDLMQLADDLSRHSSQHINPFAATPGKHY
jgi:hypothetical protein